jgi:hypothetical protein
MSEKILIEKWLNIMLITIVKNNYGPTRTARFQYLVSTILYYAFITYKNVKTFSLNEAELKFIFTKEKSIRALNFVIFRGMNKLYNDLSLNNIADIATPHFKINENSKKVIVNLEKFLNRRNNDGYQNANNIIPDNEFPNKGKFLDVDGGNFVDINNNPVDIIDICENSWTPLKHPNGIRQNYLTPYWGNIIPIEKISLDNYLKIAKDNYEVVNYETNRQLEINEILKFYENLSDQQKMIAEYFQGGQVTPPGIWNVYAIYAIKSTNISSTSAAQFLYLLNSTMFIASIAAWDIKKKYMQSRPIQKIRMLPEQIVTNFDGNDISNNLWKTFQQKNNQTPPFPDYISGHSTFSSGAAVIFERFFPESFSKMNFIPFSQNHGTMISALLHNNDYINNIKIAQFKTGCSSVPEGNSNEFPTCAVKLTFDSWRDLANHSGVSRIYGGIHGNNANNAGLIIGETIALDVLRRPLNTAKNIKKNKKNKKNVNKNMVKKHMIKNMIKKI